MADNRLLDSDTQGVLMEMWQEVCKGGGSLSFKIISASMSPTIEVGDVVKVSGVSPSKIRVGDVLAFQDGQNVVVHRIISKSRSDRQLSFRHRGDAGGLPGVIAAEHVIGKVSAVKREGREIPLDTPWYAVKNRILGWRLHFIDTVGRMRPGLSRTVIHKALRLPWRLFRSIFQRPLTGNKQ